MKTSPTSLIQNTSQQSEEPGDDNQTQQLEIIGKLLCDILIELRQKSDSQTNQREIMTVNEAADYLRFSHHTLREKLAMREIPHYKVGGSIRLRKSDLDKWINKNAIPLAN